MKNPIETHLTLTGHRPKKMKAGDKCASDGDDVFIRLDTDGVRLHSDIFTNFQFRFRICSFASLLFFRFLFLLFFVANFFVSLPLLVFLFYFYLLL